VACIVLLRALGLAPFHAIVYSLAAVSTGGFAPHNDSLAGLNNELAQAAVIFVCLLGAVPLMIFYALYEQKWRSNVNSLQLKGLVVSGVCILIPLVLSMSISARLRWSQSLYHAPLLAFSAQTTAGFSTMPLMNLPALSKGLLIMAMAIGGSAGSTAGGFKILRLLVFLKLLKHGVQRTCLAPHALVDPRIAGRRLEHAEQSEALFIIVLFLVVVALSWLAFLSAGFGALDSLFEVVSATGTVGLSTGITSAELPGPLKGLLCVDMLMGRLEFLAWLVLLYPRTWLGPRMEGI
jgi:trk/ktr system potassium uptake protein